MRSNLTEDSVHSRRSLILQSSVAEWIRWVDCNTSLGNKLKTSERIKKPEGYSRNVAPLWSSVVISETPHRTPHQQCNPNFRFNQSTVHFRQSDYHSSFLLLRSVDPRLPLPTWLRLHQRCQQSIPVSHARSAQRSSLVVKCLRGKIRYTAIPLQDVLKVL
jgi:hypothetical protein